MQYCPDCHNDELYKNKKMYDGVTVFGCSKCGLIFREDGEPLMSGVFIRYEWYQCRKGRYV